jgi:hypothetical protein
MKWEITLGDIREEGKIGLVLKWILKKSHIGFWTGFNWFKRESRGWLLSTPS